MKYYLIIFAIGASLISCKNSLEKEHRDLEGLRVIISNTEEVLLSIDTNKTFEAVRDIKEELWSFGNKYDSLDKKAAFKVAEYYGNKKSLYFLYDNYKEFLNEIELSRKQLDALEQDLNNRLITKEQFVGFYQNEQKIILQLNEKINNATKGAVINIDKLINNKTEIMDLLSNFKREVSENEE